VAAVSVAITAVDRLLDPQELQDVGVGIGISAGASLINLVVGLALGLLERRSMNAGYVYSPRLSRSEYREARARAEVGALVNEYGEVALVHFARHMAELDPERRAAPARWPLTTSVRPCGRPC
jgi:hypothetical protein